MRHTDYDVIIIGGSYAGLSAALSLGRFMRHVLVIDNGMPCNLQTPHSQNFLTQDGETPAAISQRAKEQLGKYSTVSFLEDTAISATRENNFITVTVASGKIITSQKLILASGIKDLLPDIPGFAECWGISVVHCPYCHGYEHRSDKTGIIANGDKAMHLATLVSQLTGDVTLLTMETPDIEEEQLARLRKNNIIITGKSIVSISHDNGYVRSVTYDDGSMEVFDVLYAALSFEQHSSIPEMLGCELTVQGLIKIDFRHQTSINDVFACGDNSNMMRSVANAVYSGNMTGAMVNRELTEERF